MNNRRVHHDPEYWERPNEFYPDHFLPQNVSARPTYAYIPFGIGIRSCPGELVPKADKEKERERD